MEPEDKIREIAGDESKSFDERIDGIFEILDNAVIENETEESDLKIFSIRILIEMLEKEGGIISHSLEMLQLYVMLAEEYVERAEYRPLRELAAKVLDLIRLYEDKWEEANSVLPRMIDAVGESVYNHALYNLLLVYLHIAFKTGHLDEELSGRVRKLLKLQILLDDTRWGDHYFSQEFKKALSEVLSSEEMLKIILYPRLGHLRRDPVEFTRKWEEIYYDVEEKLDYRFANAPRGHGFCFLYWNAKHDLLKDEYGIDWKSPSLMNPRVKFD
ncbi:MAG: hypothetical protein K2J82_11585 [Muribaculaceae bacterium]|nr:hypothetical protein [Muribaculaceae bacterium]MDE6755238.1 hypothetical protein [Muribaculaceae bacterium]